MKFSTSMRGYNKKEVDKYIADLEQKESNLRNAQKQHIDELADENFALRRQLQVYLSNERAIAQSLVDANNLAGELQGNAQKFAEVTLERAKTFYVAWSSYAKTLVATLSDEEVKRFNELKDKIERTINAYEGGDVASYANKITAQIDKPPIAEKSVSFSHTDSPALQNDAANGTQSESETFSPAQSEVDAQLKPLAAATQAPTNAQKRAVERLTNPIEKVQQASGQVIDLRELVRPNESLADLCRDLGLDVDETADK
ncbi:MAG: DivIVA domain-containing protein [Corallococcus sp.]|nr:DivIVA domain-containing protein [Corallococcus sp.]MCM1359115.1 DivIVA domain-containing protein [Corallococcus sp.]MCM1394505.1 DivIVA domain-containing protein [Corallococcus sp.]